MTETHLTQPPMIIPKARAALWLALVCGVLLAAVQQVAAQVVVCYKKKCVVYPDGEAICQYTPVDCSQVSIE
jgi:hypothetical protein